MIQNPNGGDDPPNDGQPPAQIHAGDPNYIVRDGVEMLDPDKAHPPPQEDKYKNDRSQYLYQQSFNRINKAYQDAFGTGSFENDYNNPVYDSHLFTSWGANYNTPGFVDEQIKWINEQGAKNKAAGAGAGGSGSGTSQPRDVGGPMPTATGSPVSATGQIPPQVTGLTLQTPPKPAASGQTPQEARYLNTVDMSHVPAYTPANFGQGYTGPTSPVGGQQEALLSAILQNPDTMSPNVLAQLQEQQKEQALLMQQQGQQQSDQGAIARGTLGSGYQSAEAAARQDAANNQILTGNRDLSIQAAQTNRQNELDAANAANAYRSQSLQEGLGAANSGLAYGQAQADENYRGTTDQLNRLAQQFGMNQAYAQNAQQNYAADVSNALGSNAQALDFLKYMEMQRQFDDQLGFNYNSLDQQGMQSLLAWLISSGAV